MALASSNTACALEARHGMDIVNASNNRERQVIRLRRETCDLVLSGVLLRTFGRAGSQPRLSQASTRKMQVDDDLVVRRETGLQSSPEQTTCKRAQPAWGKTCRSLVAPKGAGPG